MLEMAPTVARVSLALSRLLPSVLQLVNRLGSARGGVELCMQSPAVRAREQLRREQLATVEGKCYWGARLVASLSDQSVFPGERVVRAEEESGWERWGCRDPGARAGSQLSVGTA